MRGPRKTRGEPIRKTTHTKKATPMMAICRAYLRRILLNLGFPGDGVWATPASVGASIRSPPSAASRLATVERSRGSVPGEGAQAGQAVLLFSVPAPAPG